MSSDQIERILSTYKPVEGMPGYVWVNEYDRTYVKLSTLREVYEEYFEGNKGQGTDKNNE